jgi:hypothetical protein
MDGSKPSRFAREFLRTREVRRDALLTVGQPSRLAPGNARSSGTPSRGQSTIPDNNTCDFSLWVTLSAQAQKAARQLTECLSLQSRWREAAKITFSRKRLRSVRRNSPGSAQSIGCSVASARKFSIVKRLCRVISASISSGVTPVNLPTAADRVRRDALLLLLRANRD